MEPWTNDQLVALASSPHPLARRWATERLVELPTPTIIADAAIRSALVDLLHDDQDYPANLAAAALGETELPDLGPTLLEALEHARPRRLNGLARALVRVGHRTALPVLLDRIRRDDVDLEEFLSLLEPLVRLGGDTERALVREFVEQCDRSSSWLGHLGMEALLSVGHPEDLAWLVGRMAIDREPKDILERLGTFLGRVAPLMEREATFTRGPAMAVEDAIREVGAGDPGAVEATPDLLAASGHPAVLCPLLLDRVLALVAARGDDVEAWDQRARDGERLSDYPGRTVAALVLLRALVAATPRNDSTGRTLAALALHLWVGVATDRDDVRLLRETDDPTSLLLPLLLSPQARLASDLPDRVAALGPSAIPDLRAALVKTDTPVPTVLRIGEALVRLADTHPADVLGLVPTILERLDDTVDDEVTSVLGTVLLRLGPPAAPQVLEAIAEDDEREGLLVPLLGRLPCPASVDWLLTRLRTEMEVSMDVLDALEALAPREAIDGVLPLWDRSHHAALARLLLTLTAVHGVDHPQAEAWDRALEKAHRAHAHHHPGCSCGHDHDHDPADAPSTQLRSARSRISRKEKKKRDQARKKNRRKK